VAAEFQRHDIRYEPAPMDRSALYLDLLNVVNSGGARLLDVGEMLKELRALERRRGPSGRDKVDHPPNGHDDLR
jgi:hypothetical protein